MTLTHRFRKLSTAYRINNNQTTITGLEMQTKTRKKKEDRIRSAFMKSLQKKKEQRKKHPHNPKTMNDTAMKQIKA